ncbi:MAG: biopolymer transporter ExbD [Sulfuriflexus sp.]|nr:biopolymer transporter ExbD [Sulfuriflexus sp.]
MKKFDSINVIPFIDIMLVLLAIVLTTASFVAQGKIAIELPVASTSTNESDLSTLKISIDQHRNIYVNNNAVKLIELQKQLANKDKLTPIILRVDASVPFESFVSIVDILKAEDFQHLTIKTRRRL